MGASSSPSAFPGGAARLDGDVGWVLLAGDAAPRLGAALAWARRAGVRDLHVVVDEPEASGLVARRAALCAPAPTVWVVDGASLAPATAAPAPVPLPAPSAPELRALLVDAGLTVVDEDGMALGELLGLEVARITHGPDGPVLDVGVGKADRELTAMAHAEATDAARVARVVDIVRAERRPGAPPHPINQLVPERWLRASLVAEPALVDAAELHPVPSVVGRTNLKDVGVATAVGTDLDGAPLVVTCSVGVDLDLVPSAADDRAAHAPGARLVLAVPARDALGLTADLAAVLDPPAEVRPVDGDWRIPWSASA
ncbi:hypothetical protein PO878_18285 [Iamia majanohamensis]|uniref:Uncharacterized protein n=1 Tax=Iamia majanohamensis TaxID=467976 RepID=A0AAE9Y512_9ACTN|nr:hypothetical protein [Iamia majanohamensis]WCO66450.1 hypothetical protein PO878_18285 [Iamia majanohamensis]